jgi:hypothetical protein
MLAGGKPRARQEAGMSVISIRGVPTFHDDAGGGPEVGAGDLAGILLTAPLPLSARAELAACLDVEHVGPGHRLARSGAAATPWCCSGRAPPGSAGTACWSAGSDRGTGSATWRATPARTGRERTSRRSRSPRPYVMDASSLRGLMRRSPVVVDLLRERIRALTAVAR